MSFDITSYFACGLKSADKVKQYKCPDCPQKFNNADALYKHVEKTHYSSIPEGVTIKQYVFNRKNKKDGSTCVECKKNPTSWNEKKVRYERYCSPKCRQIARENFKKNMMKKYGKITLLDDPEFQRKVLSKRKISGDYIWTGGNKVGYVGSYEKHFLEYCDKVLNMPYGYIKQCDIIFSYPFDGKEKFHIPDFYIEDLNLVIQIKDGGNNPNTHPKIVNIDKVKNRLCDDAIINSKSYNYIKIVNKEYENFLKMKELLESKDVNDSENGKYIIDIPDYDESYDPSKFKFPKLEDMTIQEELAVDVMKQIEKDKWELNWDVYAKIQENKLKILTFKDEGKISAMVYHEPVGEAFTGSNNERNVLVSLEVIKEYHYLGLGSQILKYMMDKYNTDAIYIDSDAKPGLVKWYNKYGFYEDKKREFTLKSGNKVSVLIKST